MHRPSRRTAFTLVELLIVVAIIALLIAILLPSLRGARRQSRGLLCSARLHDQGIALNLYFNEYNGYIPREILFVEGNVLLKSLPYAGLLAVEMGQPLDYSKPFEPQISAMELFQCPDFPKGFSTVDTSTSELSDLQPLDFIYNNFQMNYESQTANPIADLLNDEIDMDAAPRGEVAFGPGVVLAPLLRQSWIQKPSALIYVSEAHRRLPWNLGMHDLTRGNQLPRGKHPRVATDRRHPGGIYSLYLDTHIARGYPEKQELRDWYDPSAHAVSR